MEGNEDIQELYHKLLGIPRDEFPPHHYRLLGIGTFEADIEVINNAALRQCHWVRNNMLAFPRISQDALDEIVTAKLCLSDPKKKRAYDEKLSQSLGIPVAKLPVASVASKIEPSSGATVDPSEASLGLASIFFSTSMPADSITDPESLSHESQTGSQAGSSWLWPERHQSTAVASSPGGLSWTVGSGDDVLVQIRAPWVSRNHCRITQKGDEVLVEDQDSRNGTFVNGVLAKPAIQMQPGDKIFLGNKTQLPWPLPADGLDFEVFSIGRSPDCDYVFTDKSVSQYHAQLMCANEVYAIQDLDSRNGTRVGTLQNQVSFCEIQPHLSLYFGSAKVFASELIKAVCAKR